MYMEYMALLGNFPSPGWPPPAAAPAPG